MSRKVCPGVNRYEIVNIRPDREAPEVLPGLSILDSLER